MKVKKILVDHPARKDIYICFGPLREAYPWGGTSTVSDLSSILYDEIDGDLPRWRPRWRVLEDCLVQSFLPSELSKPSQLSSLDGRQECSF
ncbi:hypothetical protein DPMN_039679 [Dreissena polymorpha]|uniref:Uncharacterized protein n=1 Tax=Dreissena polymorpha TaxID=45954 RepID=A0A9D4HUH5_DREPO|nr:hypothetical protein DPMN_039679 [Dreissena polymorpha]